jgi:hypothetical protein
MAVKDGRTHKSKAHRKAISDGLRAYHANKKLGAYYKLDSPSKWRKNLKSSMAKLEREIKNNSARGLPANREKAMLASYAKLLAKGPPSN